MTSSLSQPGEFDHLFTDLDRLSESPADVLLDAAASLLGGSLSLHDLLEALLERSLQDCEVSRGFFLLDADSGSYHFLASRGVPTGEHFEPWKLISNTIVEECLTSRQPIISDDAMQDPQLSTITSVQSLDIHSVVCVPLLWQGQSLGVLYLERDVGRFGERERALSHELAEKAATVLGLLLSLKNYQRVSTALREEVQWLQKRGHVPEGPRSIAGHSAVLKALKQQASEVATEEMSVLLIGETGTGKDLFARWIHELSPRRAGPFIAVNCAAIQDNLAESELFGHTRGAYTGAESARPGRIEQAEGGTLFLDEIGDMSPTVQAKMLRLLENNEYFRLGEDRPRRADIRVISATNRNLGSLISKGKFREDLFYRLDQYRLTLPPLRERLEDLSDLIEYMLEQCTASTPPEMLDEAYEVLRSHSWPGNVRELGYLIRRCLVGLAKGAPIDAARVRTHLRAAPRAPSTPHALGGPFKPLREAVWEFEKRYLQTALQRFQGLSRVELAEQLDLPLRTLQHKLKLFGLLTIEPRPF